MRPQIKSALFLTKIKSADNNRINNTIFALYVNKPKYSELSIAHNVRLGIIRNKYICVGVDEANSRNKSTFSE